MTLRATIDPQSLLLMRSLHKPMKRLMCTSNKRPFLRPLLIGLAAIQLVLAGFMSMPSEYSSVSTDDATVDIEGLMKQVLELNHNKEHQKAMDLLLAAIDNQREDSMLRTLLVQTFDLFLEQEIKQGQSDIIKNRQDIKAYNRVAGALELLGDNFRAMEILLNGVNASPKSPELWMKIARLELKSNRDMEALDVFREVTRLDKKNSDAYNNAAYILARSQESDGEDLQEAEKLAGNARKLDPKNPEYLDTLAEVHFRQGRQKMALSLIEEAIKLAPRQDALKNQLKRFRGDSLLIAE
jgi:Flp pilus assembly protein TadD